MGKLHAIAQQVLDELEQAVRDESKPDEKFWRRKGNEYKEDWIRDLIRKAHDNGDTLPNDWTYEFIVDALQSIAAGDEDTDDDDLYELEYEIEADVYNSDLLAWLSSNINRAGYCDEAMEELHHKRLFDVVSLGQLREKQEVFRSVLSSLHEEAETREDTEDDEESTDEATTV